MRLLKRITMQNYHHYYRVVAHETQITKISTNNFTRINFMTYRTIWTNHHPVKVFSSIIDKLSLVQSKRLAYRDFVDCITAMESAKSGALSYINSLIKQADLNIAALKQYRMDHYDDLNKNLLDSNIRRLEQLIRNR